MKTFTSLAGSFTSTLRTTARSSRTRFSGVRTSQMASKSVRQLATQPASTSRMSRIAISTSTEDGRASSRMTELEETPLDLWTSWGRLRRTPPRNLSLWGIRRERAVGLYPEAPLCRVWAFAPRHSRWPALARPWSPAILRGVPECYRRPFAFELKGLFQRQCVHSLSRRTMATRRALYEDA